MAQQSHQSRAMTTSH